MKDAAGNELDARLVRQLPTLRDLDDDVDGAADFNTGLAPELVEWIAKVHAACDGACHDTVVPFTGDALKLMQTPPMAVNVLLTELELLGQPVAFHALVRHVLTS